MGDFRGIGGVSATLRTLLADRMELPDGLAQVAVTIGPPAFSSNDVNPRKEDPRVNLFLYRVTENGHLQNQDVPGRGSPAAFGLPPLSLDLHYLVTAYGNDAVTGATGLFDDTPAHFLLGSAMRVLHDVPIVTERLKTVKPASGTTIMHASLRDQYEQVKLTLEPLSLEDVTKVWTALALRYRLSAGYVVNVVQIESGRPRSFPRPVGALVPPNRPPLPGAPGPAVHVLTIQTPTITSVGVRRGPGADELPFAHARIGDTLVLRGSSLAGPDTTVAFGDVRVPVTSPSGDHVEADVRDAALPDGTAIPPEQRLQPGVQSVRVIVSDPYVPHGEFASNAAAFVLVPRIDGAPAYVAGPPRRVTIQGRRLVSAAPSGETLIGRSPIDRSRYVSASPVQLVVPIPDSLPTRGVHVLVSDPLPDPVVLGGGMQQLTIDIGGTVKTVTGSVLGPTVARSAVPGVLAGLIHDAAPGDGAFAGARVDAYGDRVVVVPGGLTAPISITSPIGSLAADLGLAGTQPAGASSAVVSGALVAPVPLSAPAPRLRIAVGAQPPVTVPVPTGAGTLAALAEALETAIKAASTATAYAGASVTTSGSQLLLVPGAAGAVTVDAPPGDDTTAAELQLHARFAVRVRVNGAESVDAAFVELPQ